MSLFSIETAPVPLDAETYLGEKREYTQIIPETELIALAENNYIPLTHNKGLIYCHTSIHCYHNKTPTVPHTLTQH